MKAYVKPELYYEDFQLSQSVMAGCLDKNVNSKTPLECTANYQGEIIYTSANGCENTESYCYAGNLLDVTGLFYS